METIRPAASHKGDAIQLTVANLATVRLIGAPQRLVTWVKDSTGATPAAPSDEPDISITFTDPFAVSNSLRRLGLNEAPFAYDEAHFYVLDNNGSKTRLDFTTLGNPCFDMVCERGVSSIPLLIPILGIQLLSKGTVLLHSSSFVHGGKGILVPGWQAGGKTEMLLAFMAAGAEYVAHEWTMIQAGQKRLAGLQGQVQIWGWQFDKLDLYWRRVSASDRRRIRLTRLYRQLYRRMPSLSNRTSLPIRLLRRIDSAVGRASRAKTPPESLFSERVRRSSVALDAVFLASSTLGATRVTPIAPREVAERMVASLAYERAPLLATYQQSLFSHPGRTSAFLEAAGGQELRHLIQAFDGCPCYEITHPYPVSLPELYEAAAPFCQ